MLVELIGIGVMGLAAYIKGSEIKEKLDQTEGNSLIDKGLNLVNQKNEDFNEKYAQYVEDAQRIMENYSYTEEERRRMVYEKGQQAVRDRNLTKAKAYSDVYNGRA